MGNDADPIRCAELIASCCLATDLGMGFPYEHGLEATVLAMRLAEALDVDPETAAQTYYGSLLMYAGCTTDSDLSMQIFGSGLTHNITPVQFGTASQTFTAVLRALPDPDTSPLRRPFQVAGRLPRANRFRNRHFAALCEVASMLADRMGLPRSISAMFDLLTERWDGRSVLGRASGEAVPLPLRIVHVARDAAFQRLIGGDDHAIEVVRERGGGAFDPRVVDRFVAEAGDLFAEQPESVWEAVLDCEPRPRLTVDHAGLDRALAAFGSFADLVAPSLSGHSIGVARLVERAAHLAGLDEDQVAVARRAGLVHDLGRVAIAPRVWQKPGPLSAGEWEEVRLHGYHTERILHRSRRLAAVTEVACAHHERLDGTGYHRHARAVDLSPAARLLAAADAFHAMGEPRPHRPALREDRAAALLEEEASAGRLDPDAVGAVLEAAGRARPQLERPAGLTDREAEVVGLLARGMQTKQVARRLQISAKTADRHIQNAYQKMGVSTRAGAMLFAMEHGLVAWGELPIYGRETTA